MINPTSVTSPITYPDSHYTHNHNHEKQNLIEEEHNHDHEKNEHKAAPKGGDHAGHNHENMNVRAAIVHVIGDII